MYIYIYTYRYIHIHIYIYIYEFISHLVVETVGAVENDALLRQRLGQVLC